MRGKITEIREKTAKARGKITKVKGKLTKIRGKYLLLVIVMLIASLIKPISITAETKYITRSQFIKQLVQAMKLEVDKTSKLPYIDAALKADILKSNQFTEYEGYITTTDAAVLLNRADKYLYKDTLDEKLYKVVLEKRISDIEKVPKGKREDVAKVVAKGIIKGYSNGKYVQNRSFKWDEYFTKTDAKVTLIRLMNPSKRVKLSPDGQLIRTTNLPKNADKYEYVLECFPNSFYEMKFRYQTLTYYFKPIELVHYASPIRIKDITFQNISTQEVLDKYKDIWMERVETNLKMRLNVDYRTIDKNYIWLNNLRSTYTQYEDAELDKRITDNIKAYIKNVKKNKIIIKSDIIAVEPSSLYSTGSFRVRVYAKFKVSFEGDRIPQEDLIFGDKILLNNIKRGKWFEGVYDIELGTINGSSDGSDYYITNDSLIDYYYKGE